jgi:hypothetical protein
MKLPFSELLQTSLEGGSPPGTPQAEVRRFFTRKEEDIHILLFGTPCDFARQSRTPDLA